MTDKRRLPVNMRVDRTLIDLNSRANLLKIINSRDEQLKRRKELSGEYTEIMKKLLSQQNKKKTARARSRGGLRKSRSQTIRETQAYNRGQQRRPGEEEPRTIGENIRRTAEGQLLITYGNEQEDRQYKQLLETLVRNGLTRQTIGDEDKEQKKDIMKDVGNDAIDELNLDDFTSGLGDFGVDDDLGDFGVDDDLGDIAEEEGDVGDVGDPAVDLSGGIYSSLDFANIDGDLPPMPPSRTTVAEPNTDAIRRRLGLLPRLGEDIEDPDIAVDSDGSVYDDDVNPLDILRQQRELDAVVPIDEGILDRRNDPRLQAEIDNAVFRDEYSEDILPPIPPPIPQPPRTDELEREPTPPSLSLAGLEPDTSIQGGDEDSEGNETPLYREVILSSPRGTIDLVEMERLEKIREDQIAGITDDDVVLVSPNIRGTTTIANPLSSPREKQDTIDRATSEGLVRQLPIVPIREGRVREMIDNIEQNDDEVLYNNPLDAVRTPDTVTFENPLDELPTEVEDDGTGVGTIPIKHKVGDKVRWPSIKAGKRTKWNEGVVNKLTEEGVTITPKGKKRSNKQPVDINNLIPIKGISDEQQGHLDELQNARLTDITDDPDRFRLADPNIPGKYIGDSRALTKRAIRAENEWPDRNKFLLHNRTNFSYGGLGTAKSKGMAANSSYVIDKHKGSSKLIEGGSRYRAETEGRNILEAQNWLIRPTGDTSQSISISDTVLNSGVNDGILELEQLNDVYLGEQE